MSDFKTRLNEEKQQVDDRASKLEPFIGTEKFNDLSAVQKSLLKVQLQAMKTYSECLGQRLNDLG